MASGQSSRRTSAPVRYDNTGKPIKSGVKFDNTGKPIKSGVKSDNTGKPINSKSTSKTPSSTAQVPKGGAKLPPTGNLAKSLITRGVGRLVPGVGLILTAVEVVNYLGGDETAANKPVKSRGQMGRPPKEKESDSSQKTAERVTRNEPFDIKELDTELRMRQDLENPRYVKPAPRPRSAMDAERDAKELAGRAEERRAGSGSSRPSTVDTQSKKPLAKRIMEALGDNRTMERATRDRKMTEEMEMEREMNVAGRKEDSVKKAYGGMGQKKKDSVKKAYGGMVKKKHGGSANKVNMKAGFTRRGCSKG
jgi:hypothetical protein